jgi:hypothetical protein
MSKLRDEILTDPLARGYSGMTADQVYTSIYVTANRTISVEVPAWDIFDVLSFNSYRDWSNTSDVDAKAAYRLLELAVQSNSRIDVVNDNTFKNILNKARNALPAAVISAAEKNAAEALCTRIVTRAVELGLPLRYPSDIQKILEGGDS